MPYPRSRRLLLPAAVPLAATLALAGCGSSHPAKRAQPPVTTPPVTAPPTTASPPPPPPKPPAPTCPLTGLRPKGGRVPARPALAIKVENLPLARPQTGLNAADIVYEEPVEGGITRFIVVYQCGEAPRVEPVRSARLVDPDILVQFGHPLFGFAGGIGPVLAKVARSGLIDLSYSGIAAGAYFRDPSRVAPHNLYTSTAGLWRFGHGPAPKPVFTYSAAPADRSPSAGVEVNFSPYSDVFWRYVPRYHAYARYYNRTQPALLSDGRQISAADVVVQAVSVHPSIYVEDPLGTRENDVGVVGSGRAMIFRDGVVIRGTWRRPKLSDITQFFDAKGRRISLRPGRTWVELVPDGRPVIPAR